MLQFRRAKEGSTFLLFVSLCQFGSATLCPRFDGRERGPRTGPGEGEVRARGGWKGREWCDMVRCPQIDIQKGKATKTTKEED